MHSNNRYKPGEIYKVIVDEEEQDIKVYKNTSASCGSGFFSEGEYVSTESLSSISGLPSNCYMTIAIGDSMDRCGILHGDYVFFKPAEIATTGCIVLARYSEGVVIKAYEEDKKHKCVWLHPQSSNPDHHSICIPAGERLEIIGIVLAVQRHHLTVSPTELRLQSDDEWDRLQKRNRRLKLIPATKEEAFRQSVNKLLADGKIQWKQDFAAILRVCRERDHFGSITAGEFIDKLKTCDVPTQIVPSPDNLTKIVFTKALLPDWEIKNVKDETFFHLRAVGMCFDEELDKFRII